MLSVLRFNRVWRIFKNKLSLAKIISELTDFLGNLLGEFIWQNVYYERTGVYKSYFVRVTWFLAGEDSNPSDLVILFWGNWAFNGVKWEIKQMKCWFNLYFTKLKAKLPHLWYPPSSPRFEHLLQNKPLVTFSCASWLLNATQMRPQYQCFVAL